jgi:hypothetical protein
MDLMHLEFLEGLLVPGIQLILLHLLGLLQMIAILKVDPWHIQDFQKNPY